MAFYFNALRKSINNSSLRIAHFHFTRCDALITSFHQRPKFQLHKILWVAVSSTVGLRVERRHHLQSVCLQDFVLVDQVDEIRLGLSLSLDQTDEKSGWSVLQHPPYSPDLAPSEFHLFGPLKQHLRGKHIADDDAVQHEVLLGMRQQLKEFYAAGIGALMKRWDKCINTGGNYVEK
ncbi:hypothetical protein AVEN_25881-1 [Araneus ventricosus]|uniref:Histone-lysine N-methyltransferase SETMAR n=1 Tax=Araneus ventricosus TaxID=182803 RepID=A0A4Y2F9T9_ARAVE|nr:hypothetical protein AVEN_25881-1 [Araneus ventricosus]